MAATPIDDYLAALPPDRQKAIATVREVIRNNLPEGIEESFQFGMIAYQIPLSRYPRTYNGLPLTVAALASQKGHMALYLMSVYGDPATRAWFEEAYAASGKKLRMGKSCVRFRALEDLPLDVVGQAIAQVSVDAFLAAYESAQAGRKTSGSRKPKAM